MAEDLDIRFGSVVTRIAHDEAGVAATLEDGTEIRAEAVVLALPINAGFVLRPAGEDRLFMGFSVQDRVDLSNHDEVAKAVNAHLPDATVTTTGGHDWVSDRFSQGTWLSVPPTWFSDGTFEALAEPEGRLSFAGSDIASEGAGWIEGAVGSGAAVAAHVRGMLAMVRSFLFRYVGFRFQIVE